MHLNYKSQLIITQYDGMMHLREKTHERSGWCASIFFRPRRTIERKTEETHNNNNKTRQQKNFRRKEIDRENEERKKNGSEKGIEICPH